MHFIKQQTSPDSIYTTHIMAHICMKHKGYTCVLDVYMTDVDELAAFLLKCKMSLQLRNVTVLDSYMINWANLRTIKFKIDKPQGGHKYEEESLFYIICKALILDDPWQLETTELTEDLLKSMIEENYERDMSRFRARFQLQ